jgi:uncharacterized membrane protein HdeD (DUF308 family)
MNAELLGTITSILPVVVQMGRANPKFPEWAALLAVVVIGVGGYALSDPNVAMTQAWWAGAATWLLKTAGIVQIVSTIGNMTNVKQLQTSDNA